VASKIFILGTKMTKVICDTCDVEFEKVPSKVNENNYCCKECYYESLKGKNVIGEDKIKVSCEECEKVFKRAPSKIERNDNHFCSVKCQNEWQKEYHAGKSNPMYEERKETYQCGECGSDVEKFPSEVRKYSNVFCNKECYSESQEKVPESHRYFYGSSQWESKREEIRNNYNNQCVWCEEDEKELHVHHMNPISNGGEMLEDNNLIPLCQRCHSVAHKALSV
jgi:hypothetical protein